MEDNLLNKKGWCFEASIQGVHTEGLIQVENGEAYLCQDSHNGTDCSDKLGYNNSWIVRTGSKSDLIIDGIDVSNLIYHHPRLGKSWRVFNDGSQDFKDTVLSFLKEHYKTATNGFSGNSMVYYGVNRDGSLLCGDNYADNTYTIRDFAELTGMNPSGSIPKVEKPYENLTGRYLKALIDHPQHVPVLKGKYIKISAQRSPETVELQHTIKGFVADPTLSKCWELMPEGFEPKPDIPTRISFYVKYTEGFTEELYRALHAWAQRNSDGLPRGYKDSYIGLKNAGYYVFDNWGLNKALYEPWGIKSYGVDNNRQGCDTELSIVKVKSLIGFKELEPVTEPEPDYSDLLAEAARRYPIGTKYIGFDVNGRKFTTEDVATYYPRPLTGGIDVGIGYVYHFKTKQWAEVVDVRKLPVLPSEVLPAYEGREEYLTVPEIIDKYWGPDEQKLHINPAIKLLEL